MDLRRLPLTAALVAAALLTAKSLAIAATGEPYGPAASAVFYPALLAAVVSAVTAGLALGAGRGWPVRAGLVVACLVGCAVVAAVGDVVGRAVVPAGSWVAGEANLWALAAALLVLGAAARRRTDSPAPIRRVWTGSTSGG